MAEQSESTAEVVVAKAWPWIVAVLVLVALGFAWALLPLGDWLQSFSDWINGFGAFGVIAFGIGYVVAVVLLVPGAVLTFAAAVAYGWWALPLVLVAASIGAVLGFLISRYLLRDRVRTMIESRPTVKAAADAVDEQGWKVLLLLRTSPVVPFSAQNYLFGITRIPLPTYLAASAGGMIPGTLLNVYLGVLGAAAGGGGNDGVSWGFLIAGLIATIAAMALVTWKAREKLKEAGVGK